MCFLDEDTKLSQGRFEVISVSESKLLSSNSLHGSHVYWLSIRYDLSEHNKNCTYFNYIIYLVFPIDNTTLGI